MKENGEPCITNFGLMHALEVGCDVHTAMALLELGSVRWMAPEIYDAELVGKERGSPTKESDCHSFGMLVLEVNSTSIFGRVVSCFTDRRIYSKPVDIRSETFRVHFTGFRGGRGARSRWQTSAAYASSQSTPGPNIPDPRRFSMATL